MEMNQEAECEWKMMHNPAMQSSNKAKWNVSMLLSLGLLTPKTSYRVINDSHASLDVYQSTTACIICLETVIRIRLTFRFIIR